MTWGRWISEECPVDGGPAKTECLIWSGLTSFITSYLPTAYPPDQPPLRIYLVGGFLVHMTFLATHKPYRTVTQALAKCWGCSLMESIGDWGCRRMIFGLLGGECVQGDHKAGAEPEWSFHSDTQTERLQPVCYACLGTISQRWIGSVNFLL